MKKISSTLLLVALTFFAFAQKDKLRYCKYTFTDNGNELCTAIQSNSFKSDKEAAFSINKLLEPLGLKANFILVPCANIKNCAATIYKEKRYIVYDLAFMQDIQNATKNNWTSISIMGHELGHHLNGHTLSATSLAQTRNDELEADEFSGFIMYKLGATIIDAQAAMLSLPHPSCENEVNSDHPCLQKRLDAISIGWEKAKKLDPKNSNKTQVDSDGDGIVDASDFCPYEAGLLNNSGCPNTQLAKKITVIPELKKAKENYEAGNYEAAYPVFFKYRNSPFFAPEYQNNFAFMLDAGKGTAVNFAEALIWYNKAAEAGNTQSQLIMGLDYGAGLGNFPQNEALSKKWFKTAAEHGNGGAMVFLGIFYQGGAFYQQDEKEAFKWFYQSALRGCEDGYFYTGGCYEKGLGTDKDLSKAIEYYKKGAAANNDRSKAALVRLGY